MEDNPEIMGGSLCGSSLPRIMFPGAGGAPRIFVFFDEFMPSDTAAVEYYRLGKDGRYRLVMERQPVREGEDFGHGG